MFADDNRVVDHDTDRHNHAEQADHVNRLTAQQHDPDGGEHCRGDAGGDPECNPDIQKQEQHTHDEHETTQAIAYEQTDPLFDRARADVVLLEGQGRWQGRCDLRDRCRDDLCRVERIGVRRATDIQLDRRLTAAEREATRVLERFAYRGDVAQQHLAPVRECYQLDLLDFGRGAFQSETAYLLLTTGEFT